MAGRLRLPVLRAPVLNLLVALWMLVVLNQPFWAALWQAAGGWEASRAAWLLTLPMFALIWVWLSLELLTWGRAAKTVLGLLLIVSAAVAYFMQRYGITLDRGMLTNVMETDPAEVRELLSPSLAAWVIGLGVLPAALIWRWPRAPRRVAGALLDKGIIVVALLLIGLLIQVFHVAAYASFFRNHRELRLQFVPTNFLSAAHSYTKARLKPQRDFERVAADARRLPGAQQPARPMVLVLVVGETMRAANLAMNGYARSTTPLMAVRTDLINFGRTRACGTATAVSLPCMFLDLGRAGYEDGMAYRRESLLDVLQSAGLDVWWLSNNSGCKGVCDRVQVVDVPQSMAPGRCDSDGCHDEVLLDQLQQRLAAVERDTVLVLHMKGQHGPAYYRRYPASFERFGPVCKDNALDRCSNEQVVNAYDNAVGYSDHVLNQAIELLQRQMSRVDPAMLFISDHGESLGEKGLFLHGMPYDFAPSEQKEVPFLAWMPGTTQQRLGINRSCIARHKDKLSHDNLYHSVLGLTGTRAATYRQSLDIFAQCQGTTTQSIPL